MTFNSLQFFLFLPFVWLIFYWSPDRWRWLVLLVASLGFYAALKAPYLLTVLIGVSLLSWWCGKSLAVAPEGRKRSLLFWGGVGGNVSILAVLKVVPMLQGNTSLWVSIGVSYFVFQAISYLADIYLDLIEPEKHFGQLLLSLAFFPKLLQGPIERSGDLLPQLKQPYVFDYDNMRSGLLLFALGLFKKVVIADRLALFVNAVYNEPNAYAGLPLILATYVYALQLYFDFSGYTDMALGVARLFNVRLTQNFNSPYLATSVAEFWRRWHISFSRWILDYIFKPLQLSWRSLGNVGTAMALLVTFLLSGIWHGVSWGFLIWGGLHGCYLAASVFYKSLQNKIHKRTGLKKTRWLQTWQILVTFNLVAFSWIFFRANSLTDALYIVTHLFAGLDKIPARLLDRDFIRQNILFRQNSTEFVIAVASLACVGLAKWIRVHAGKPEFVDYVQTRPVGLRWAFYVGLTVSMVVFAVYVDSNFIYYRF